MSNKPYQVAGVSLMERPDGVECIRCADSTRAWDRIGNGVYCPQCMEEILQGVHPHIRAEVEKLRCAVCRHLGTVPVTTKPLRLHTPVRLDLCSEHVRQLIYRNLDAVSFGVLQKKLSALNIPTSHIYLLHDDFYSDQGEALQPVNDSY